jgi:hypothetical protein
MITPLRLRLSVPKLESANKRSHLIGNVLAPISKSLPEPFFESIQVTLRFLNERAVGECLGDDLL